MKKSIFNIFTILAFMFSLSACQNPVISENTLTQSMESIPASWVKIPAVSIKLNSQIHIPKQNQLGMESFTIKAIYDSALGHQCMQAESDEGGTQVLCQTTDNYWQAMPLFNQVTSLN